MLKKVLLATAVTGLIAGIAVPIQTSPAQAQMTCKEAAKLKYPDDRKTRNAYRKACKEAWKGSQTAAAQGEPTYAGDL
jgi:hypothetical protein